MLFNMESERNFSEALSLLSIKKKFLIKSEIKRGQYEKKNTYIVNIKPENNTNEYSVIYLQCHVAGLTVTPDVVDVIRNFLFGLCINLGPPTTCELIAFKTRKRQKYYSHTRLLVNTHQMLD